MKRKFAIANHSLEACEEFLSDPAVVEVGGEMASRALSNLGLLYIPNVKHGVYQLEYEGEEDPRIPLIVADRGEEVRIARDSNHAVHPWVWESIRHQIAEIDTDEMTDEAFSNIKGWITGLSRESNGEIISIDTNLNSYAFVFFEASAIGIEHKKGSGNYNYGVETRPIIVGISESMQRHEARSNMYHELIHVEQFLSGRRSVYYPGMNRTWVLRRGEIEAYSNQAVGEAAYYDVEIDENPYGWASMSIEQIRRQLNTDRDPYRVSKNMMKLLGERGLRI